MFEWLYAALTAARQQGASARIVAVEQRRGNRTLEVTFVPCRWRRGLRHERRGNVSCTVNVSRLSPEFTLLGTDHAHNASLLPSASPSLPPQHTTSGLRLPSILPFTALSAYLSFHLFISVLQPSPHPPFRLMPGTPILSSYFPSFLFSLHHKSSAALFFLALLNRSFPFLLSHSPQEVLPLHSPTGSIPFRPLNRAS